MLSLVIMQTHACRAAKVDSDSKRPVHFLSGVPIVGLYELRAIGAVFQHDATNVVTIRRLIGHDVSKQTNKKKQWKMLFF